MAYERLIFHLWFLVILSEYNIWAFLVMNFIIYKQYARSSNDVSWWCVKFYVILQKLFHSPCQNAPNNCLAIL